MEIPDEGAGTWRVGKHESKVKERNAAFSLPCGCANVAHDPNRHCVFRSASLWTRKGHRGIVNAESAAWASEKCKAKGALQASGSRKHGKSELGVVRGDGRFGSVLRLAAERNVGSAGLVRRGSVKRMGHPSSDGPFGFRQCYLRAAFGLRTVFPSRCFAAFCLSSFSFSAFSVCLRRAFTSTL